MNTTVRKKLGRYLIRTLFGLLFIAGLLIWLAGSESALQWSARQAVSLSNGTLTLQNVQGSLYGPLHIDTLSYQTDETRYEIKQVNLNWAPRSLLWRHAQLKQLSVQELKIVQLKPATEPAQLPASLQLPVTFNAQDVRIERIVFVNGSSEQSLRDIHFDLAKTGSHYQLNLHNIDTGWGNAQAEILLGDTHPFSVTAHATMQQKKGWIYNAEADVSGNLVQLLLKGNMNTLGGKATINATLTPFEAFPIVAAQLSSDGINPARLRKDLPEALLSAAISLEKRADGDLQGSIKIDNALPGPWDKSRLPVREISAHLSGTPDQLDLKALHLHMGKAGEFNGKGQIRNGQLKLDLNTSNLNPHELYSKVRQMRLDGNIRLLADEKWQELTADLRYQRFKLHLAARHQDNVIQLREATIQSATGSLNVNGKLALDELMKFQLAGKLKNLNPAHFGAYPEAKINASFSATGKLAAEAQAGLTFSISDSHYRQQPLSGQGSVHLSATRVWDSDVKLQLGHNSLEIQGNLGKTDDQLKLAINAPSLADFDPELRGKIFANGVLEGSFSAPSGSFDLQINKLSWRKHYRIDSLHSKGRLNKGLDGTLLLDTSLAGLATPQLSVDQASLNVQGTRRQHTLKFMSRNSAFNLNSKISGSWHEDSAWTGVLEELDSHGRQDFTLRSPTKIEIASQHFLLGPATIELGETSLVLHQLTYNAGQFSSIGELKKLQLAYLQNITGETAGLKTDLALSGSWQVEIAEQINGHIALWRDSGDVSLPAAPKTTLGLNRLTLNIDAINNQLQGRLEADGSKLGKLRVDAQVMLTRRDDAWGIAGNAPINAQTNLSVESLAWLAPLLDKTGSLAFDGAINAEVNVAGTFAQPQLAGSISGERFIVALQNQGLRFNDGSFKVTLHDQTLLLDQFVIHGGKGSLSGQGKLTLEGESPDMQISLKADKLEVLSRPDRLLILSGSASASATGKKLQIESSLKADQGLIELPKDTALTSSDDVTVLGQTAEAEKKALPYVTSFDLDLDLGERFYIKGKGLDAQLGGTLKLSSKEGSPLTSRGSIHVIKGAYTAYGQRLVVERGILNFQGPLDNPGLNILAMRKNQAVEAGVAVTGTALSPRVKLASNPDVPDSEKLSWLVLGHGLENSSGNDYTALNAAAGALLTAGESITLQQKIAHASGFEEVSVRGSGELEGTVLSLGKRLSSRAYLNYEQGLTNASSLVKITYTLTRRVSVQAQAGTTPALDLFYTFRFD